MINPIISINWVSGWGADRDLLVIVILEGVISYFTSMYDYDSGQGGNFFIHKWGHGCCCGAFLRHISQEHGKVEFSHRAGVLVNKL